MFYSVLQLMLAKHINWVCQNIHSSIPKWSVLFGTFANTVDAFQVCMSRFGRVPVKQLRIRLGSLPTSMKITAVPWICTKWNGFIVILCSIQYLETADLIFNFK